MNFTRTDAITLCGLVVAICGSIVLFKNNATPQFMEEDKDGNLTFRHPGQRARERRLARVGFGLLIAGFVFQAVGVGVPLLQVSRLIPKSPQVNLDAPIAQGPITFATEARRGFYAVFHLKPNLPVSELEEAVRSVQYQNLTNTSPSDGFTLGVHIGAAARFNSEEFSDEEKAEASKLAHGYAQTVLVDQRFDGLTDNDMQRLCPLGFWPTVKELAKQK